jgi:hypothetical protein
MMLSLVFQLAVATTLPDTSRTELPPRAAVVGAAADQQDTTRRRRARSIEVSEWYHRRLVVHKALSYAMVPVFTAQYVAGKKLYDSDNGGPVAPGWAKPVHRLGAGTVAGIFGVNTVTGLWNLWDSRQVEEHRWLRLSHAAVMLGADAAFAYTGIKLSEDAGFSLENRRKHRNVALYSMGASIGSGIIMKVFNR